MTHMYPPPHMTHMYPPPQVHHDRNDDPQPRFSEAQH
jgi:hypothetical protein